MVSLVDSGGLDSSAAAAIQAEIAPLGTLQEVVRHVYSRSPRGEILDVVIQDEFTHDVIVSWGEHYLVFDTT